MTCRLPQGVIENLLSLVEKLGFVPNGSRVYYEERSQPPLLTAMARSYYEKTKDIEFIRKNMPTLEKEFNFWMNNSLVQVRSRHTYAASMTRVFLSRSSRYIVPINNN